MALYESIDSNENITDEEKPSKTQRKKAAQNLQKLGEFLVTMPTTEINNLDISEELKKAIKEAKNITTHGAKKRQLQYIGVLMRESDKTLLNKIIKNKPLFNKFSKF